VDGDGDGKPDTAWIQQNSNGKSLLGITTASGATFGVPYSSASPIPPSMLVAPVDNRLFNMTRGEARRDMTFSLA